MSYQFVSATTEGRDAKYFSQSRNIATIAFIAVSFALCIGAIFTPSNWISQSNSRFDPSTPTSTAVDALCSNVYRVYAFWGGGIEGFFNCVDSYGGGITNLE